MERAVEEVVPVPKQQSSQGTRSYKKERNVTFEEGASDIDSNEEEQYRKNVNVKS